MKKLLMATMLIFSFAAHAESLTGCKLYVDGQHISDIVDFNIDKYTSNKPEASIDGGLFAFSKTKTNVNMSFSNECDNMYEITFSKAALAKAKSGEYKTIIGKASIGNADIDKTFVGVLKCTVSN